jgi:hypothetical protein
MTVPQSGQVWRFASRIVGSVFSARISLPHAEQWSGKLSAEQCWVARIG